MSYSTIQQIKSNNKHGHQVVPDAAGERGQRTHRRRPHSIDQETGKSGLEIPGPSWSHPATYQELVEGMTRARASLPPGILVLVSPTIALAFVFFTGLQKFTGRSYLARRLNFREVFRTQLEIRICSL